MVNPIKKRRWRSKPAIFKKYSIELADGFRIVAEYQWLPGKMKDFALVLIRPKGSAAGYDMICRYDTAHDFAHFDLLNNEGRVVEKVAVPGNLSYKEAFLYAQDDLKKNYQRYWQAYRASSF